MADKQLSRPNGNAPGIIKVGVPSKFSWPLAKTICERIQNGEFLSDICQDESMPSVGTVGQWSNKYPKFGQWLERSRKIAAHVLAEKSVKLFDEEPEMEILQTKNGPYERISMAGVQREGYKAKAMQWLASKWASDQYGDKRLVEATLDLFGVLSAINTKQEKPLKSANPDSNQK